MAANLYAAAQNGVFTLVVRTLYDQKTINDICSITPSAGSPAGGSPDAWGWAQDMSDFFGKVADGAQSIAVEYSDGNVTGLATNTLTFSGNPSNNDTITIGGVTITLVTGTPSGSQVKIGTSQAATMTNIVSFINSNGSANNLIGLCNAAVTSANVITLTSDYPGLVGNLITLAKSSSAITVGAGTFSGGALVTQSFPILSVGM